LLPVRLNFDGPLLDPLARILDHIQQAHWRGAQDNDTLITQINAALMEPARWQPRPLKLEAGGAVPLDSEFYIVRPTDEEFKEAIARNDSIVLVKGARQMSKTSLLARGLHEARVANSKVVLTDFQQLNTAHVERRTSRHSSWQRSVKIAPNRSSGPEDPFSGPLESIDNSLELISLVLSTPARWSR
jgi:hypothetical protein